LVTGNPTNRLPSNKIECEDVSVSQFGITHESQDDLWPKEKLALQKSGQVLKETIKKVLSVSQQRDNIVTTEICDDQTIA